MIVLEIPVGIIVRGLAQGGLLVHPRMAMRARIRGRLPLGPGSEQQQQRQQQNGRSPHHQGLGSGGVGGETESGVRVKRSAGTEVGDLGLVGGGMQRVSG